MDYRVTDRTKYRLPFVTVIHELSDRIDGFNHRLVTMDGIKGDWAFYSSFCSLEIKGLPGKCIGCMSNWSGLFTPVFWVQDGEEVK